ncbi:MAG TPA: hypothetical protein VIN09_10760 [Chloroflexota bacterium]
MGLLDYDYDELARRLQTGLDRITVSFLRKHRARVLRDIVDFHGNELVELEVVHEGHRLHVRQTARQREGSSSTASVEGLVLEDFESTFDGRPTREVPVERLARWLASLPPGEAPEEPTASRRATSELDAPREPDLLRQNPFAPSSAAGERPNPFAVDEEEKKRRKKALEAWLRGEDDV